MRYDITSETSVGFNVFNPTGKHLMFWFETNTDSCYDWHISRTTQNTTIPSLNLINACFSKIVGTNSLSVSDHNKSSQLNIKNTLFVRLPSETTHMSVRLADVPIGIIWSCLFLITIEKTIYMTALWFADTRAAIISLFYNDNVSNDKGNYTPGGIFLKLILSWIHRTEVLCAEKDTVLFFSLREVHFSELKVIN